MAVGLDLFQGRAVGQKKEPSSPTIEETDDALAFTSGMAAEIAVFAAIATCLRAKIAQ